MAEALMQMYETMTETAQKELYDFALFLISCAQCENLTIITRDTIIPKYDVKTVW